MEDPHCIMLRLHQVLRGAVPSRLTWLDLGIEVIRAGEVELRAAVENIPVSIEREYCKIVNPCTLVLPYEGE